MTPKTVAETLRQMAAPYAGTKNDATYRKIRNASDAIEALRGRLARSEKLDHAPRVTLSGAEARAVLDAVYALADALESQATGDRR